MDLLLDTQVLLWWESDAPHLAQEARVAIAAPGNRVYVSSVTPWEIAIKRRKGKLEFEGSPSAAIAANGFLSLPILPAHGEAAGALDWEHVDPFDRMLVAQAQREGLVLVHGDAVIRAYGAVSQLWAR